MCKRFIAYFNIDSKLFIVNCFFFLLFFLLGYYLQSSYNNDSLVEVVRQYSFYKIFFHNIIVATGMILGTIVFGYVVFSINCLFLGASICGSLFHNSLSAVFGFIFFHGLPEIVAWLLTLQISITFTKYLFKRKVNFNYRTLYLTLSLYFLAAIVESVVILLR